MPPVSLTLLPTRAPEPSALPFTVIRARGAQTVPMKPALAFILMSVHVLRPINEKFLARPDWLLTYPLTSTLAPSYHSKLPVLAMVIPPALPIAVVPEEKRRALPVTRIFR